MVANFTFVWSSKAMYQGWQISLWYCRPVNAAACAAANASKSSVTTMPTCSRPIW